MQRSGQRGRERERERERERKRERERERENPCHQFVFRGEKRPRKNLESKTVFVSSQHFLSFFLFLTGFEMSNYSHWIIGRKQISLQFNSILAFSSSDNSNIYNKTNALSKFSLSFSTHFIFCVISRSCSPSLFSYANTF